MEEPLMCTYNAEEGICLNDSCPKTCARNYHDQLGSDLPTTPPGHVYETNAARRQRTNGSRTARLVRWLTGNR